MDTTGRDYVKNRMPMIGLGTYQVRSEETIYKIVDAALAQGYRFIDTAQIYGNEPAIGQALKELLPKYKLTREEIFITTKISPANQGRLMAGKSIEKSLANLETSYIDLIIIHWPGVSKLKVNDAKNESLRKETYEVLQEYHKDGKVRAIGVSNYEMRHLEQLLAHCNVLPALNQVEYHPFFHQTDLVEFCRNKGIHFQAYSSLGGPDMRDRLFEDTVVKDLARKYEVSVPVFLLAWAISQGVSVLPRSKNPDRVKENYKAIDIQVVESDVKLLLNNEVCEKACWDPSTVV